MSGLRSTIVTTLKRSTLPVRTKSQFSLEPTSVVDIKWRRHIGPRSKRILTTVPRVMNRVKSTSNTTAVSLNLWVSISAKLGSTCIVHNRTSKTALLKPTNDSLCRFTVISEYSS